MRTRASLFTMQSKYRGASCLRSVPIGQCAASPSWTLAFPMNVAMSAWVFSPGTAYLCEGNLFCISEIIKSSTSWSVSVTRSAADVFVETCFSSERAFLMIWNKRPGGQVKLKRPLAPDEGAPWPVGPALTLASPGGRGGGGEACGPWTSSRQPARLNLTPKTFCLGF